MFLSGRLRFPPRPLPLHLRTRITLLFSAPPFLRFLLSLKTDLQFIFFPILINGNCCLLVAAKFMPGIRFGLFDFFWFFRAVVPLSIGALYFRYMYIAEIGYTFSLYW